MVKHIYGNNSRCHECKHKKGPRKLYMGKDGKQNKKAVCSCPCHIKKTEEKHLKPKQESK
jgi:hypothetical protein